MGNRVVWANRYAIFDEIASGSMATIYLAGRLGEVDGKGILAVKKLLEAHARQPDFVNMFLDEARMAASVRHPNVIKTFQVLRIPDSLAIVMEYVAGASLVDLLKAAQERRAPTSGRITGAIMAGVLRGLHAAHEAHDELGAPLGIVHRDVSPHNILVGRDGIPRVIDFGIAKAAGRLQVTTMGVVKGKYAYMAPEQIRAGDVDRRTDTYAAGVVLWEMLTGRSLFEGASDSAGLAGRVNGTLVVPPPSTFNRTVTRRADELVLRALACAPDRRFATADEMARAVEEALGRAGRDDLCSWVERLAQAKLRDLDAKFAVVDRAFAAGELEEMTFRIAALPPPSEPVSRKSVVFDVPDLDLPVPSSRALPSLPPAALAEGGSPSSPELPPASRRSGHDAFSELDEEASDVAIVLDDPRFEPIVLPKDSTRSAPARGTTTPVGVELPSIARVDPAAASIARLASSRAGKVVAVAMALAVLVGAGLALQGSTVLESLAVRAAARRGLRLTVDGVSLGSGGLTLHGASVAPVDSEAITVRAPQLRVRLDAWGSAEKVTMNDWSVEVRGSAIEVAHRFTDWAKEPHPRLVVDARGGTLRWFDAAGAGVHLEGGDVSLSVGTGDEPSLHADTKRLTLTVGGESLGPWSGQLAFAPEETRVDVASSPRTGVAPATLTLLVRPTVGALVSVKVPRGKLDDFGCPARLFGLTNNPDVDVDMEGQVFPSGEPVNARVRVGVHGEGLSRLTPLAADDVTIEGAISGPPSQPLKISSGVVRAGGVTTPFRGQVILANDGVRLEVDGALGATPQTVRFDSRSVTTAAPSR